jgi:hypothetical protein
MTSGSVYGSSFVDGATGFYVDPAASSVLNTVYATSFFYSSDERMKTDIRQAPGLDLIRTLEGRAFTWRDGSQADFGLVAQEVEQVAPELVGSDPQGRKAVRYVSLIGPLIESVKELSRTVEAQQQRIVELETSQSCVPPQGH